MDNSERIIIDILKVGIAKEPLIIDWDDIDLEEVHHELGMQAISPMAFKWLDQSVITDQKLRSSWIDEILITIYSWHKMLHEQDKLVNLLNRGGFKFVIMKGFANAALYPKPELRMSGDIDFLVEWDKYEEVYKLLLQNGYELVGEKDDKKHHVALKKNSIMYELHRQPGGTRRKQWWQVDFFQKGLQQAECITLKGYTFPTFSVLHNGIMLLVHTRAHFASGIGLRHLLDWLMYADKYLTDEFWNTEMKPIAEKFKVDELAAAMSRCGQLYFGLLQGRSWCDYIEDIFCENIITYMIKQGDFGKKARFSDAQVKVIAESEGLGELFRRINRSAEHSMPIIKKCPILRPIGWIYQVGRYAHNATARNHSMEDFKKDIAEGNDRRSFLDRLEVRKW